MLLTHLGVFASLRLVARRSRLGPGSSRRGARFRLQPGAERLESRLAPAGLLPSTYVWTAGGDQTSWNDPNNWTHFGPTIGIGLPGTPTPGSDIDFPPVATLPANSPTTIDFNSPFVDFPIHILTIQDSYTFQGNPVTIEDHVFVLNAANGPTAATVLLGGLTLDRGAAIYTQPGSMLTLGSVAAPTSPQLILSGDA